MSPLLPLALLAAQSGTLYGEVRVDGRKAFTLERTAALDAAGVTHVDRLFRDLEGKPALRVVARLRGHRAEVLDIDHAQVGKKARVHVYADRVTYRVVDADGEKSVGTSEVTGPVFVGPALIGFMQSDEVWSKLEAGGTVPITMATWRRMDTYGFQLRRHERSTPDRLVVMMECSTWLLSHFVGDMFYTFDRKTREIQRYQGRVAVKKVTADGDLEDTKAEIIYFRK